MKNKFSIKIERSPIDYKHILIRIIKNEEIIPIFVDSICINDNKQFLFRITDFYSKQNKELIDFLVKNNYAKLINKFKLISEFSVPNTKIKGEKVSIKKTVYELILSEQILLQLL